MTASSCLSLYLQFFLPQSPTLMIAQLPSPASWPAWAFSSSQNPQAPPPPPGWWGVAKAKGTVLPPTPTAAPGQSPGSARARLWLPRPSSSANYSGSESDQGVASAGGAGRGPTDSLRACLLWRLVSSLLQAPALGQRRFFAPGQ